MGLLDEVPGLQLFYLEDELKTHSLVDPTKVYVDGG